MARLSPERFVDWIDAHRRAIVLGVLLLGVLSALSLVRLRFDMDVLAQLPTDAAAFRDYREYLERFGVYDGLYVVVRGEQAAIVAFADRLAPELAALPEVESVRHRVDAEAAYRGSIRPRRFELLTEADYDELATRLEPAAIRARLESLRRALAMPMSIGARRWLVEDPFGVEEILGRSLSRRYGDAIARPTGDYLLAPAGDALLVLVRPKASAFDTIFAERLLDGVAAVERRLLDGPFAGRGIEVGHTGSYVYARADKRVLQRDFGIYFVLAPVAVLAIFHWGLRTLRILPFVTLPLVVTTTVTFAASLLCFGTLNMISVAFSGIFYGLGVDSSIYFYTVLRDRAEELSGDVRAALAATVRELLAPNLVATTTTAGAFLVVALSDFTGVSQLGLMTALAMLLNVPATLVLLPALVLAWGARALPVRTGGPRWVQGYGTLAATLARRPGTALACILAVVLAAASGLPGVRLDTDFRNLRPTGGEAEEVEGVLRDRFGHVDAQAIALVEEGTAEDALRRAESVAERLEAERAAGAVGSVSSLTVLVPSRETAARRLERFRSLPRAEAAAALRAAAGDLGFSPSAFDAFLSEWLAEPAASDPAAVLASAPLSALREQHVRQEGGRTTVATYFVPPPGGSVAPAARRLRDEAAGTPPGVAARELVADELHALLARELAVFLGAALALNLVILLVAERTLGRALAMLYPTLAVLVVYLGAIGALDVPIDPVNLIVLPLLVGLGVDHTVYLVAHARAAGSVREGARRGALPLALTVGTTVAGFGSLGLSQFPALGRLGLLAGFGLLVSLAAALLVAPVVSRLVDPPRGPRPAEP